MKDSGQEGGGDLTRAKDTAPSRPQPPAARLTSCADPSPTQPLSTSSTTTARLPIQKAPAAWPISLSAPSFQAVDHLSSWRVCVCWRTQWTGLNGTLEVQGLQIVLFDTEAQVGAEGSGPAPAQLSVLTASDPPPGMQALEGQSEGWEHPGDRVGAELGVW